MRLAVPFPDQDRPGSKLGSFLVKLGQSGGHPCSGFPRNRSIKDLPGGVVEIAKAIGLNAKGEDGK